MAIEKLLTRERIKVGIQAADWRDLVDQVGEIMVAAGDVHPRYIQAMKNVIEEIGTYCVIAPGVVLLHARPEEGVNRVCLAVATLREGINFGCENDPVWLAIGLGAVDHGGHIELLRDVARFLSDKANLTRLREAETEEQLLQIICGKYQPS
ncbi:MAG: PTS sugar transporter subunit IIA [Chloroflexi bacterium]|nr:PTS sugar transporter subunit IIA [Chloroflexota bacterium]